MSNLLNTVPGDLPDLLRHGSPVLWDDEPCLVQCSRDGTYQRVDGDVGGTPDASELVLDLTDATGRAHAAWWIQQRRDNHYFSIGPDWLNTVPGWYQALRLARAGADMTPEQIDTLARIVLRLAGRTP